MKGQVTADRLRARMDDGPWDVVHFIGHGQIVNDEALVRLNDENAENDDQWVNGEIFASFFQRSVPRLVVLNCCWAARRRSADAEALSFLLRAGNSRLSRCSMKFRQGLITFAEFLTGAAQR